MRKRDTTMAVLKRKERLKWMRDSRLGAAHRAL